MQKITFNGILAYILSSHKQQHATNTYALFIAYRTYIDMTAD